MVLKSIQTKHTIYYSPYDSDYDPQILDMVVEICSVNFPDLLKNKITIINSPANTSPFCYFDKSKILLCSKENHFCQLVYQFAHELLHYSLTQQANDNLHWFEEALCEMNSHYVLNKLSAPQSITNFLDSYNYRHNFKDYSLETLENCVAISIPDIPTSYQHIISYPYSHRDELRYIAKQMLPIFLDYPELFKYIQAMIIFNSQDIIEDFEFSIQRLGISKSIMLLRSIFTK